MELKKKRIGKLGVTANGKHNIEEEYEALCIVYDSNINSYLSKKNVPKGISLTNEEYWQPFNINKENIKEEFDKAKEEFINIIIEEIKNIIDSDKFNINIENKIRKIITNTKHYG